MSTERNTKTAIITGGSSGMGFGVAKAYVERGGNVVVNGRSESKLHAAAKEIGPPERVAVVAGDVGLQETGQRLVKTAVDRFGRVDLLLNNAGTFAAKPFTEYTAEELEARIAGIDVIGTVATVRLELDNWTGSRFTDLFTLLKIDGEWKIMNKVFHLHPEEVE